MKRFSKLPLLLSIPAFIAVAQPSQAQFSDTYDFMQAVVNNDITTARSKIFEGVNVNGRRDGFPIFMIALQNRYYEMARLLLDNGAYVNLESLPGQETALMQAAATGDERAITLLLEYNADVNAPNKSGQTALMRAAQSRKTGAARMLIEAGADVFQTDYVGRDALQYAKEARARSVVRLLEDAGVN